MENKVKNFEEYLDVNEGLFHHADWVDMDLLQEVIERMRSDEYKQELISLNEKFPIDAKVKWGFDVKSEDKEKFNASAELDKNFKKGLENHPPFYKRILGED